MAFTRTHATSRSIEWRNDAMASLRVALGKLEESEPHAFDGVFAALRIYGDAEFVCGYEAEGGQ